MARSICTCARVYGITKSIIASNVQKQKKKKTNIAAQKHVRQYTQSLDPTHKGNNRKVDGLTYPMYDWTASLRFHSVAQKSYCVLTIPWPDPRISCRNEK